jgi:hypothetical protein
MKPKNLFFVVLFGITPGRAEKNEPKPPDALDVGPGRAPIFPTAGAQKLAMSGKNRPN